MSNKNVAQYVMLAEASYADLTDGTGKAITNDEKYAQALKDSKFALKEDDGQITLLKDNWSVVANWKDRTDESSFSATLFKGTEKSGEISQYVLAFKGSDEFWKDFVITDFGDIVLDGFALKQSIDLINFRQRLTTKDDNYKVIVLEALEKDKELKGLNLKIKALEHFARKSPTGLSPEQKQELAELQAKYKKVKQDRLSQNDYITDGNSSYKMTWQKASDVYDANDPRARGLGLDLKDIVVTGHSLGGNLSAIYSTWFNQDVKATYMVNGAGFHKSVIENNNKNFNKIAYFLQESNVNSTVNTAIPSEKINNITGDKAPNIVAQDWGWLLNQPGEQPEVFIEAAPLGFGGHLSSYVTDSMAVIDLFLRIDKSLANESIADIFAQFNPVLKAAAKNDKATLENIVNALDKLYFGKNAKTVPIDDRGALYERILALQTEIAKDSTAKVITDIGEIIKQASEAAGIAARYALKMLNPFAVVSDTLYDKEGVLKEMLPELGRFYYALYYNFFNIYFNFRLFKPKFQGALN